MAINWGKTIFDQEDLNPLGNPLDAYGDSFVQRRYPMDEKTGIPEIDDPWGTTRRWNHTIPLGQMPQMPSDASGLSVTGVPNSVYPSQIPGTQPPSPTPPVSPIPDAADPAAPATVPPRPKLSGWQNVVNRLYGGLGDALQGASTPNIAGGGGFDVVRSLAVGNQARTQREHYEKQQQIAEEQRKIEAEERKRKVEYEAQKNKREQVESEARTEAEKARKESEISEKTLHERQLTTEEKKAKFARYHVTKDGIYDLESQTVTRLPEESGMMQRHRELTELRKTNPNIPDPQSPEGVRYILYGEKPDPNVPKPDTSTTPFEVLLRSKDPKEIQIAKDYLESERRHNERMANIRSARDAGAMTPRDFAAISGEFGTLRREIETSRRAAADSYKDSDIKIASLPLTSQKAARDANQASFQAEMKRLEKAEADGEAKINANFGIIGATPKKGGGMVPPSAGTQQTASVGAPPAAGGGGLVVKAPNGKTYRFKTQAEADAFKKAAGIP